MLKVRAENMSQGLIVRSPRAIFKAKATQPEARTAISHADCSLLGVKPKQSM